MILSLDCETSGLDLHHAARPYYVTTCDDQGTLRCWEWPVAPKTRRVHANASDVREIQELLDGCVAVVAHNVKFDASALVSVGLKHWPWEKTYDTLLAAHLLHSNQPKDLTALAIRWLASDITPYEERLKDCCLKARRLVRSKAFLAERGRWAWADESQPGMPSLKGKGEKWKNDAWMPKLLAQLGYGDPSWRTVLEDYANADSATTLGIWPVMRREIERRELWGIYLERLKLLPVAFDMEQRGVTANLRVIQQLQEKYTTRSATSKQLCVNIAGSYGYDLELPKGAVNNSLRTFCFDVLKLEPVVNPKAKTSNPSLDSKNAIPHYLTTLPSRSRPYQFVKALATGRKVDTQLGFLSSYQRFGLAYSNGKPGSSYPDWMLLYQSTNPTGTDTLRWSFANPNTSQVSKQENECPRCAGEGCEQCAGTGQDLDSMRTCFGPAPGREWWSMDYSNLELRIPAYESGEKELIDLFEHPDDPPYYGSEHLLNFSTVYPDIWEAELKVVGWDKVGPHIKTKYKSTYYQDCKNGGFAVGYGAMDRPGGTADRTFKRPGSHARLKARFAKKEQLNQHWIRYANKHGYVETLPDKTVDPTRGYPLLVTRSERGAILPTVPLNYHVQGSAMWATGKAMIRCDAQLRQWQQEGFDGRLVLQVHDELVFDFPAGGEANLSRASKLRVLMEQSGDDIGIPLKVSMELHRTNWGVGEKLHA